MILRSFVKYFFQIIYDLYIYIKLTCKFKSIRIAIPSKFNISDFQSISFGENFLIGPFSEIVVVNDPRNFIENSCFKVGNNVTIGSHANIRASGGPIVIGDDALLAQGVTLIAANHHIGSSGLYRNTKWDTSRVGIEIGKNVWLGANVVILPGVHIGENSIIASGAVVTTSVPENEIWGGVPARFIKFIFRTFPDEGI